MKRIKNKIMVPVYVMVAVFICFTVLQIALIYANLARVKEMENVYYVTSMKAADLKLSVVQVQQWLTDISATRGAEGFDDGFDEAEVYAQKVQTLVGELKTLNPDYQQDLEDINTSFSLYYETGKKMAAAFIAQGPVGGNVLMAPFDTAASDINTKVDKFVELSNKNISDQIRKIGNSNMFSVVMAGLAALVSLILCILIQISIGKNVVKPIRIIRDAAKRMAVGDLNTQIIYEAKDETGQMADDMRATMAIIHAYIEDITYRMKEMGNGNLAVTSDVVFQGDFIALENSMVQLSSTLSDTISQINLSSDQVTSGAEQVSHSAQALAQGATEQASAVEELASEINEISVQVKENAKSALQANLQAGAVGEEVVESNRRMQQMLAIMNEISNSAGEIGKIIKTIEDIAFQTNILALNAAVEAARAGVAGKGFAVVADEVRNLANKSQEASKNTSALIENAISAVNKGTRAAKETATSLYSVEGNAQDVAKNIDKISEATAGQSQHLIDILQGIEQVSSVVQTNSATAEESAAASEELSAQAKLLKDMVGQFTLNDSGVKRI